MSTKPPTIFVVSGGVGSSGEQLVNTIIAQFSQARIDVVVVGNVRHKGQILESLTQARAKKGFVVHTLVENSLRVFLLEQAQILDVPATDMTGPLMDWLTQQLSQQPVGRPGLYRQLRRQYFERVEAIDYTMAHDDGKDPEGWPQADLMLVGVSRSGKTPLSVYLAVLGWKAANYPIVPQIPVPEALFHLDPSRVFGLTIDMGQLLSYRMQRQAHLGTSTVSEYVNPEAVEEELKSARRIFRRGGFHILDMTDKTIEMGADEIQRKMPPRQE